ncbi:hypothetical protein CEW81_13675 [Kluyvera genomosp. 3]|uniref:Uncharacterized protein n=1 Tax=Kluyvera genomosp. 3 TaxID=2774055 RepID=A0A248KI37_9ENTR|nr:hypothetical protein CEW81_13675 [Kluyvera genomosp. 3]
MTDSFKPRIDFDGPLDDVKPEQFKTAQAFEGMRRKNLLPSRSMPTVSRKGRPKPPWKRRCGQNVACGAKWLPLG